MKTYLKRENRRSGGYLFWLTAHGYVRRVSNGELSALVAALCAVSR